jgi:hypothetical protein
MKIRSVIRRVMEMKKIKRMLLILVFLISPSYAYSQLLENVRISLIDGDVQIRTEDTGEWVPTSINMPLRAGDRIWVPEGSKTELSLRDGSYVRLGQESGLEILATDKDSFQFYLFEGHAYINFRGLKGTMLQMETSLTSMTAYGRTDFRIDVALPSPTKISVFKGSVYAETREGKTTVEEGTTLSIGEEAYAELSPLGAPDAWEKWNRDRDRMLAERRPPSNYLPEELHAYSKEFDDNGSWTYVQTYGYVWRPAVAVSVGWAPYRIGRWVWMGGDYVWISYEPWGWVPYHYGRWVFVVSIGWCWVPPLAGAVYWGPGYVGWVYTPTYVAWVPLAPYEIYYGYGSYGPYSVNITYIKNVEVNKVVYKNVHVQNAVTVIHRDTFVTGKPVQVTTRGNPFLENKIHAGRPDIKPEKGTVMPVVAKIPQSKRPPERVAEAYTKDLKAKRPLVKEKDVSVFKPGSRPNEMPIKKMKPVEQIKIDKTEKPVDPKSGKATSAQDLGRSNGRLVKPQEPKVPERVSRDAGRSTQQKPMDKPVSVKPPERTVEKPKEYRPPERVQAQDSRSEENRILRSREVKAPQRSSAGSIESRANVGKAPRAAVPGDPKATERAIEKPSPVRAPEKGTERSVTQKPPNRGVEQPGAVTKGSIGKTELRGFEGRVQGTSDLRPGGSSINGRKL